VPSNLSDTALPKLHSTSEFVTLRIAKTLTLGKQANARLFEFCVTMTMPCRAYKMIQNWHNVQKTKYCQLGQQLTILKIENNGS